MPSNLQNPSSSTEPLHPVRPVRPPAAYIGGKRRLAARICAEIDAIPHNLYAEPFVGMGGVFLRRERRPRAEVVNDINGDVVALFRVLQRHYAAFIDELRFRLTSREEFDRLRAADPTTLTDLERAARFLYLQRLTFGGKVAGRTYGGDTRSGGRFNVSTLEPLLADLHERLAGVVIECLGWQAFLRRYDRPGALFYLDPPYWDGEADYGKGVFAKADFEELADTLATLKGRFILSINDRPETRALFGGFPRAEAELLYSVGGGKGKPAKELIVTDAGPAAPV